jgi:hypothetical protein
MYPFTVWCKFTMVIENWRVNWVTILLKKSEKKIL